VNPTHNPLSSWNVPTEIHRIMQDAQHFDDAFFDDPINQNVPAAATTPSDTQYADTCPDLVARLAVRKVRPASQRPDGLHDRLLIVARLLRTEGLGGPMKNGSEVLVGRDA
jgi:hypothetical protein